MAIQSLTTRVLQLISNKYPGFITYVELQKELNLFWFPNNRLEKAVEELSNIGVIKHEWDCTKLTLNIYMKASNDT